MIFRTHIGVEKIFILGAGASVDYGLPTWDDLRSLLEKRILETPKSTYEHRIDLLNWLKLVGPNCKYQTIDQCIEKESLVHDKGHEVENQLFLIMKDLFDEISQKKANEGWIGLLNRKILKNRDLRLERQIAFVNYNYDNILDNYFLNFSNLHEKERRLKYKRGLKQLSGSPIDALYPHGNFYSPRENSPMTKHIETMKSEDPEFIDAVSCYESDPHEIITGDRSVDIELYILGLGAGLEVNLNNIEFHNDISRIHITIRQDKKIDKITSYLQRKFNISLAKIYIYEDCEDLINKCF